MSTTASIKAIDDRLPKRQIRRHLLATKPPTLHQNATTRNNDAILYSGIQRRETNNTAFHNALQPPWQLTGPHTADVPILLGTNIINDPASNSAHQQWRKQFTTGTRKETDFLWIQKT